MAKDEWEKIDAGNFWQPELPEDKVEGVIISKYDGNFGTHYVIETPDGKKVSTPSHKVLHDRMSNCQIGDSVRIVYMGELPPKVRGQNPTKLYEVYKKRR